MAEVKWIKITTDMFDNRKIKHLRKLPDGNNLVLIWIMLLTMAGRCNANGMIFLTETFPYSPKMLADELDFEENTVKLALSVFETLGMITFDGDFMAVTGWEEYQNVDGMEQIRIQNRIRKQRQREKEKAMLEDMSRDSHVTVTGCHATDIDKDIDKDIKERNIKERNIIPPTVEMVRAYCLERGNNVDAEKFCDFYESKNWYVGKNKMKDWQAAVRTWEKQDGKSDAITKTQRDLSNVYSGISQEEGQKLDRLFGKE